MMWRVPLGELDADGFGAFAAFGDVNEDALAFVEP
jgi:hypothetical protein